MAFQQPNWAVVCSIGLILIGTSLAQEAKDSQSANFDFPSARQVIDRHVQASGGFEILGSRDTVHYISQGHSSQGSHFQYEVYQAEGRFKSRFDYDNGRVIERGVRSDGSIFPDGSRQGLAWELSNGALREMGKDEQQEYLRRRASVTATTRMFEHYKSIEFVSSESIDGREVYQLLLTDHNGKEIRRFYDAKTGLLRRQICDEALSNRTINVVRDYLNYKSFGDYTVSTKQVITQATGGIWTYEIELYEVNERIPRGTFDMPRPIATQYAQLQLEQQKLLAGQQETVTVAKPALDVANQVNK